MPNEVAVSEFDKLFAEIIESVPERETTVVAEVSEDPQLTAPPVLNMAVVEPVVATTVSAAPRYEEVEGKVFVDGGPCQTVIYPKGYCQFAFGPAWNKCALYEDQVLALRDFMANEARFSDWLHRARLAGLKARKASK